MIVVDASSDDNCSQKSSNSSSDIRAANSLAKDLRGDCVSAMKRADEEEAEELNCNVQLREKEDRDRLTAVRTLFYTLNEKFE